MRIVVTGASGNVGTALLRELSTQTHDVVAIARRTVPELFPYNIAQWRYVDLSAPHAADLLVPIFDGADVIIHLAWGFQPTRNPDYQRRVAVDGSAAVLAAAHQVGVPRLVHQSSVGVYAPVSPPGQRVDESGKKGGIESSEYHRNKIAVEEHLDEYERTHPDGVSIARTRPGFIFNPEAASGMLRYFLPGYIPGGALKYLPLLPLDDAIVLPVTHADDVARALIMLAESTATGAFNLCAPDPIRRSDIARAIGAKEVQVPLPALRAIVKATWQLRLQPVSVGWLDLAFAGVLMNTSRAQSELGWAPTHGGVESLNIAINAMKESKSGRSQPLRKRTLRDSVQSLRTRGGIDKRQLT